jgi:LacI family transcriptional regulator
MANEKVRMRSRAVSRAPVRLKDVAALADVSAGTVSRVFSAPHLVAPETISAVRAAVDKLGWVPHGAARALASHKSHTIGAIIPNLANPVFAQMIYAIQNALLQAGYVLVIGCSEYQPDKALTGARAMIERGVDGLILLGENFSDSFWHLLEVQKVPNLVAYSYRPSGPRNYIGFDNIRAARLAAEHLLNLGHTRLAIIAQEVEGNDRAAARLYGFVEAIRERGRQIPSEWIRQRPWSIAMGQDACEAILASGPLPPTALLCGNDYLAAGALAACRGRGLRVPDDISVVGFDDLEIAAYLSSPLTTVRVPAGEIGTVAAQTLLARLETGTPLRSIELEATLVVRGSTAPPPGGAG